MRTLLFIAVFVCLVGVSYGYCYASIFRKLMHAMSAIHLVPSYGPEIKTATAQPEFLCLHPDQLESDYLLTKLEPDTMLLNQNCD